MTICHNYSTRKTKLFLNTVHVRKKVEILPANHRLRERPGFREGNLPYRHASTLYTFRAVVNRITAAASTSRSAEVEHQSLTRRRSMETTFLFDV